MKDPMWTLTEGVALCQELDSLLRSYNAFIALSGSVLHKGWSIKDLDLVIIPLKKQLSIQQHVAICRIFASRFKFMGVCNTAKYKDDKYVEKYQTKDEKRIDVIFLKLE